MDNVSSETIEKVVAAVWDFYDTEGRHDMPWRQPGDSGVFDPYAIMVSEVMLQQTQVGRVWPKYQEFMRAFPTAEALAGAPLDTVLHSWSGLGYNRRAKFLWQAARMVQEAYGGTFPRHVADLVKLPGVGVNTAGAIAAYAFDAPVIFIETNIRTVLIHAFFDDDTTVDDADLRALLEPMLRVAVHDGRADYSPRTWYWALMDYGSFLKRTAGNAARRSRTYARQSPFAGSRRQVRGRVLRALRGGPMTRQQLYGVIEDKRLDDVLTDLQREGLIAPAKDNYRLGSA